VPLHKLSDLPRTATEAVQKVSPRFWRLTPAGSCAGLTKPAVVVALWVTVAVTVWNLCTNLQGRATRPDFAVYYASAMVVNEGHNPYTTGFERVAETVGLQLQGVRHATDPPSFLLCIAPLARMTLRRAFFVWSGFNAMVFIVSLTLMLRSLRFEVKPLLALAALAVLYVPVPQHFYLSQSKIPILLILLLMLRSMERGSERTAGLFLALAGLLRVFPLLLLGYLAIQRRWRVFSWTLIGLALGGLVTVWLFGLSNTLSFREGILLTTSDQFVSLLGNIAVSSFISSFFLAFAQTPRSMLTDTVRFLVVISADAGLLALTIGATRKLPPHDDPDWRGLTLWIVASVLLSPTAWVYDMVLFLLPLCQIVVAAGEDRASGRTIVIAMTSYALLLPAPLLVHGAQQIDERLARQLVQQKLAGQQHSYLWTELLIIALAETWFFSAILTYVATYWFTADLRRRPSSTSTICV
jgi:hypothetical protein